MSNSFYEKKEKTHSSRIHVFNDTSQVYLLTHLGKRTHTNTHITFIQSFVDNIE